YAAAQVGLFMQSHDDQPRPDAQVLMTPYSTPGLGQQLHPFSAFTLSITQSWPGSRGVISLRDADPASKPVIQPGYLSTPEDRVFFINIVRTLRLFAKAAPLDQLISAEHQPGAAIQSDQAILDFVHATAGSLFHPCGTCRMGSDEDAVVDTALRLRGVSGVRIADASVMPTMTSGNINATCLMIAEKAADLILADQAG
ncbi:MAG: GMC oxidoreductase, partial [Burkholderiales bacterium]